MSVQTGYTPDVYQGDGISTAFPVTFVYQSYADLVLSTTVVATGVVTPLVYGTDYTVLPLTNSPATTGTVTLLTALPAGTDLTIDRSTPITQLTVWTPNDPNPSSAIQNATDKLTLIAQELEAEIAAIPSGGGSAIVTTAVFAIAVVSASQVVSVNTTTGLVAGNIVQISNVALTFVGQITALTSTTLTITTLAIVTGTAGSNIPVGTPVQLGQVPAVPTTITAQDNVITSSTIGALTFTGDVSDFTTNFSLNGVKLYMDDPIVSQNAVVHAYAESIHYGSIVISTTNPLTPPLSPTPAAAPGVLGWATFNSYTNIYSAANVYQVLQNNAAGNDLVWALLTANNITAGSLTPTLLQATNSPADTQIPAYDVATGKFTWTNPGGGGVPGGGNAGQFLSGAGGGTWSQWLDTSLGDGAFFFGNSTATNAYSGFVSQNNVTPAGVNAVIDIGIGKYNGTHWLGSSKGIFNLWGAIAAEANGAGNYTAIDSAYVEDAIFGNYVHSNFVAGIVRAGAFRSGAGYWQYAHTVNAPGASLTVDIKNGAYQRHTGHANNVSITMADSTPAPNDSNFQYANELTLEINAPGIYTYTWPGTVTWANGGSAPTLSTSGINVIRLIRRQGQTQWVGYTEGGTFSLTAGIINNTAYFAALSVPISAINASGTPGATTVLFGNGTWAVPSGSVLATNNGVTISGGPFTTLQFGANLVGSNLGSGVLGIAAAGGGGGAFSPATSYTWTATQNYTVPQNFNGNFLSLGGSTIYTSINNSFPNIIYSDAAGVAVYVIDNQAAAPGAGGIKAGDFYRQVNNAAHGCNSFYNQLDLRSTLVDSFSIGFSTITTSKRITGSAAADGVWLNSWSPCNLFSASPDATGIIHTWTTGYVRAGEINFGNAWADFGKLEFRAGQTQFCAGLELFPDWLAGNTGATTENHYDAQWAICIGQAGPDPHGVQPRNWTGLLIDKDGISGGSGTYGTGGYGINMWGSVAQTNAAGVGVKMQGKWDVGVDTSLATISAETTSTHSNHAAIQLAQGQAICFKPPTGANTGVYIEYDGTNLRCTKDGGNTWTTLV